MVLRGERTMNVLLKNALRNTFGKPLRTILVIFTIFVCSISAMLCFDLSGSLKEAILNDLRSTSSADYGLTINPGQTMVLPEGFPEADQFAISLLSEVMYTDIPGEYNYAKKQSFRIMAIDFDKAERMNFIDHIDIDKMEVAVTCNLAKDNGFKEGDMITLHDRNKEPHEFKVVKILSENSHNYLLEDKAVLINMESFEVLSCGKGTYSLFMIDVKDDELAPDAKKMLEEAYGKDVIEDYLVPEDILKALDNISSILTMVFAITFLLVVFVTYSICERIVNERMSLVGTLRSLGMSAGGTAKILLMENVIYALFGSVPAVILYSLLRGPLMDVIAEALTGTIVIPQLSPVLLISVVLGAVLIECLIPLRAILKALKISIRDIIFDNRDTEYKFSKPAIITGFSFWAIALVLFFFRRSFPVAIICMVCTVTGLAFAFPYLFKLFTKAAKKLAVKRENPSWGLALTEAISRKSTVASGMLCATSAAMCIVVFAISLSGINTFASKIYSADVVLTCTEDKEMYSFVKRLDGVTGVENLYSISDEVRIGDLDPHTYGIYGIPEGGYKYYRMFRGLPDKIEDGTVYIHRSLSDIYGLKEGDTLTFVFNNDLLFQIRKEMTIAGMYDTTSATDGKNSFLLSDNDYIKIFHDQPAEMLIAAEDPEKTAATINRYTPGGDSARTRAEIEASDRSDAMSSILIFMCIIGVAVGMTCIGMVSNQIIGFEGRKKELAVMLSTAMSRKKLSGVLLREVLTMSGFASALGVITGGLVTLILNSATSVMEGVYLDMSISPIVLLVSWIVMTLVYSLTVLFPIARMKKMKISEQIKYE